MCSLDLEIACNKYPVLLLLLLLLLRGSKVNPGKHYVAYFWWREWTTRKASETR